MCLPTCRFPFLVSIQRAWMKRGLAGIHQMMAARQSNAMLLCNHGRLAAPQQGRPVSRIRKSFARLAVPLRRWTDRPAGLVFEP
jgi:hypothetical protein